VCDTYGLVRNKPWCHIALLGIPCLSSMRAHAAISDSRLPKMGPSNDIAQSESQLSTISRSQPLAAEVGTQHLSEQPDEDLTMQGLATMHRLAFVIRRTSFCGCEKSRSVSVLIGQRVEGDTNSSARKRGLQQPGGRDLACSPLRSGRCSVARGPIDRLGFTGNIP